MSVTSDDQRESARARSRRFWRWFRIVGIRLRAHRQAPPDGGDRPAGVRGGLASGYPLLDRGRGWGSTRRHGRNGYPFIPSRRALLRRTHRARDGGEATACRAQSSSDRTTAARASAGGAARTGDGTAWALDLGTPRRDRR